MLSRLAGAVPRHCVGVLLVSLVEMPRMAGAHLVIGIFSRAVHRIAVIDFTPARARPHQTNTRPKEQRSAAERYHLDPSMT